MILQDWIWQNSCQPIIGKPSRVTRIFWYAPWLLRTPSSHHTGCGCRKWKAMLTDSTIQ